MDGMRELSLFSGAGGGLLGTKLLGWRTIGYVEYEKYCQKVIRQRIADGLLDAAPVYGDIRRFISEGYAERYRGVVEVITAGFPCQPFSVTGKQLGADDPRNMWPATLECLRIIRPRFALLENVPGLLVSGYFGTILRGLAEAGYNAKWCCLGGFKTGNCSNGERLWVFAIKANSAMLESMDFQKHIIPCEERSCRRQFTRAVGSMLSQDDYTDLKRDPNEVARGMERFKAIGNGQVPIVAATAWRILTANGGED